MPPVEVSARAVVGVPVGMHRASGGGVGLGGGRGGIGGAQVQSRWQRLLPPSSWWHWPRPHQFGHAKRGGGGGESHPPGQSTFCHRARPRVAPVEAALARVAVVAVACCASAAEEMRSPFVVRGRRPRGELSISEPSTPWVANCSAGCCPPVRAAKQEDPRLHIHTAGEQRAPRCEIATDPPQRSRTSTRRKRTGHAKTRVRAARGGDHACATAVSGVRRARRRRDKAAIGYRS